MHYEIAEETNMNYKIAVIPGDGIGPEVIRETKRVLDAIGEKYGHRFEYAEVLAGGCAIDETGQCLPEETVQTCRDSDAFFDIILCHTAR